MNKSVRPYELLGEARICATVEAFYDHMERDEDFSPLRQMHGEDLSPMRQKLGDYLLDWLGGPAVYREKYGSLCMTKPHKPFAIGECERDMWLACFERALATAGVEGDLKVLFLEHIGKAARAVRNRD